MLDTFLRVVVAIGLFSIPWLQAYLPEETRAVVVLLGSVGWVLAFVRWGLVSRRKHWGLICFLVFLGLQAISLLNVGTIDPGQGFPGDGQITKGLWAWLPGTVSFWASVRWLAWWWGMTGLVAWASTVTDRRLDPASLWYWALFLGAFVAVCVGLAGKAGYILPRFSSHHGVFQPFGYRNHGVVYAVLGVSSGLALAVRWWPRTRFGSIILWLVSIALLIALPWSQSRFAFVPQLVIAAGLLFLCVRLLRPQWQRAIGRIRTKLLFVFLVAVGLASVWLVADFTGRMRDTRRQLDLALMGEFPDLRLPAAGAAIEAGWSRFPWGWGGGSFTTVLPLFAGEAFYAEVYQPQTNNFGRLIPTPAAHNDWAEWWSDFGALGLGLLIAGGWLLRPLLPSNPGTERTVLFLGMVVLVFFSCFDYPLHTPPVLFAGVVFWFRRRV